MRAKQVFNYLSKCNRRIKELAKANREGYFSIWFDYISAFVSHGCLIDHYVDGRFYMYRRNVRKRIMTYRRLCEFIRICNKPEEVKLLNNKTEFNRKFSKWISRKWLHSTEMSRNQFENLYNHCDRLIVKPLDKCEGKGIYALDLKHTEEECNQVYEEFSKQDLLIAECLVQHPALFFSNVSVNTIRVNSLLDKEGNVHLFKAVLRVGIGDSVVDNYNAGGVEYPIDIETGIISSLGFHDNKLQCIYHPLSDKIMPGFNIPYWDKVVFCITEASKQLPLCRFVGWDIAITKDGVELIEGNHNPGYVSMEYFGEIGWYGNLKKYL